MDYIRSRNALADLTRRIDVRALFAGRGADLLSRYPRPFAEDRFENLYRYYDDMVSTKLDPNTGLAVLSVEAFTADDAAKINSQLLDLSEDLVNRLNAKARENANGLKMRASRWRPIAIGQTCSILPNRLPGFSTSPPS
jgi:capsular polysaccharide transport system permease protein